MNFGDLPQIAMDALHDKFMTERRMAWETDPMLQREVQDCFLETFAEDWQNFRDWAWGEFAQREDVGHEWEHWLRTHGIVP